MRAKLYCNRAGDAECGHHLRNEHAAAHLGTRGEDGFAPRGHRVLVRNGRRWAGEGLGGAAFTKEHEMGFLTWALTSLGTHIL